MNTIGSRKLAGAVLSSTLNDLKGYVRLLGMNPKERVADDAMDGILGIKRFVRSQWFEDLCSLADVDIGYMKEKVQEVLDDN